MGFDAFCGKDTYKYVSVFSPEPVNTMGYRCAVATVLVFATVAFASVRDNSLHGGERIFLGPPIVAPPNDSKNKVIKYPTDQFPVLVPQSPSVEHEAKSSVMKPLPVPEQVILN